MPRRMDRRKRLAQDPESQTLGVLHPVGKAGVRVAEQAGPLVLGPGSGRVHREGAIRQTVMRGLCGFD